MYLYYSNSNIKVSMPTGHAEDMNIMMHHSTIATMSIIMSIKKSSLMPSKKIMIMMHLLC